MSLPSVSLSFSALGGVGLRLGLRTLGRPGALLTFLALLGLDRLLVGLRVLLLELLERGGLGLRPLARLLLAPLLLGLLLGLRLARAALRREGHAQSVQQG